MNSLCMNRDLRGVINVFGEDAMFLRCLPDLPSTVTLYFLDVADTGS